MARNQIAGNTGNTAEVNSDGSLSVSLTGSYTRLSTEPKPTVSDGAKDGNDLLLVDTGQVFVFYQGVWREI
ncbi:MAG: hypothetical protein K0Q87_78 [Neobacillus sp.]|jgi:hypothetical protein|nr:hypothetical protein [Neobacillus sp.]